MQLQFPENFIWGTSTAAAQIETASDHNWKGVASRDGYVFDRTTDHEKRRMQDIEYIRQFGKMYRCGVDWARLQPAAFADFEPEVVKEYQDFFKELLEAGMEIMFVLHHFTNPMWFERKDGWLNKQNIPAFVDYCEKCIQHFGDYVANWNTFNEPNVYAMNAYMLGNFPPMQKSYFKASKVLRHMGHAHDLVYKILKEKQAEKPVGISLNTAYFKGKNLLGRIPAWIADNWFHKKTADLFSNLDYFGISYYAYVLLDPAPITFIDTPEKVKKLGMPHDGMWLYNPEGLAIILRRVHNWYKKPIIITENGICTDDQDKRIASIKDYLKVCHKAIEEGIDLRGYIHWSTWDNFEWNLGPTYRFGLVRIDMETKDRSMTKAGKFYAQITQDNAVEV